METGDGSATHHPGPQAETIAQETQRDTAVRLSFGVGVLVSPPARLSVAVPTPNQRPDSSHRKDTGRSEGQQGVAAGPRGGCSLSGLGLHLCSGDRSALELERTPLPQLAPSYQTSPRRQGLARHFLRGPPGPGALPPLPRCLFISKEDTRRVSSTTQSSPGQSLFPNPFPSLHPDRWEVLVRSCPVASCEGTSWTPSPRQQRHQDLPPEKTAGLWLAAQASKIFTGPHEM